MPANFTANLKRFLIKRLGVIIIDEDLLRIMGALHAQPLIEAHAAIGPADPLRPPPVPRRKNRGRRRGPSKNLERIPPSLPSFT